MSLLVSTVVMATAALGPYHLDGDAQGNATLAWTGFVRDRKVVRVVDVRGGRPGRATELWSGEHPANGTLDAFDVSPGGAAVACVRTSAGGARPWRVQVIRRPAGGAWGKPIRVRAAKIHDLVCATDDTGQVTVAWGLGGPVKAVTISADGRQQAPVTLARDSVDPPQVAISPSGSATIAFTVERRDRTLYISQHGPGGWTTRPVAPAMLPSLAMDGSGRAVVGWSTGSEADNQLRFAAGPEFVPQTLITEQFSTLSQLVASPRGDVLAAWQTHAWAFSGGPQELHVILQRPGEVFGAPISLGRFGAYPREFSLAADGTGAAAWNSGNWRRPRLVVRVLGIDGTWRPPSRVPGSELQIVAAPGGQVTTAWQATAGRRDTLHVGLVAPPVP